MHTTRNDAHAKDAHATIIVVDLREALPSAAPPWLPLPKPTYELLIMHATTETASGP